LSRVVKKTVRLLFDRLGYRIHRKTVASGRTLGDVLRLAAQTGFHPKTVIDIGVARGTAELYEFFPGAKFLLIEALAEFEPDLQRIAKQHDARYVIAAAGRKCGSVTINVHRKLEGSTIFQEQDGPEWNGIPREVPMVAVDDVCEEMGFEGPYLIKADIQGAEIEALEGANRVLRQTELVIVEGWLIEAVRNVPLVHEVVQYMDQKGFVLFDAFGGLLRPLDGALGQIDLAFVRERGVFRSDKRWGKRR